VIKRYHAPATPYERALTHPKLSHAIKRRLRETYRPIAVSTRWCCSPKSVGARTSWASASLGGGLLRQLMSARQTRSPSHARSQRMQAPARFARRTDV
jgi:hypothetical protein